MNFSFDARTIKPSDGGQEAWAGGRYALVATAGEVKPTRDGTGNRLALTVECIDGPLKGKKSTIGFNLQNASQEAVKIAWEQLSSLCWCINTPVIQSYNDFFGKPFTAFNKPNDQGNNWGNFQTMDGRTGLEVASGAPAKQLVNQAPQQQAPQPGAPQQNWQPQGPQPGATPAPNGPAPGWQGGAMPNAPAPAWGGQAGPQGAPAPAWGGGAPQGAPAPQQNWQAPGQAAPQQQMAPAGWQPGGQAQPGAAPAWGR